MQIKNSGKNISGNIDNIRKMYLLNQIYPPLSNITLFL